MRTLLVASAALACGCASSGSGAGSSGDDASMAVYLYEQDLPCEYITLSSVSGMVTYRSLLDYERFRDAVLVREAQALEADAVLIPEDREEPGRDGAGLALGRLGGVTQTGERQVEGLAVRFLPDTCEDPAD